MSVISRGLILPVVCAAVFGGTDAAAATVTKTYTYNGTVANACSLSASSVGLTVSRGSSGNTITQTFSPATVTAGCNAPAGGVLSVSSTRLKLQGSQNTFKDYKLNVTGWGAGVVSYTTAPTLPPPTTQNNAAQTIATLSFQCDTSNGCKTSNIGNSETYTATVTLGIAANP